MQERMLGVSAERFGRLVWTLILAGFMVLSSFVGWVSVSVRAVNAAPKPHVSTYQVTDCSNSSDTSSNNSTSGTLAYALANYSSGDTIQFACTGGTSAAYTINIPSTITVTKDLTLNGNSYNVTLDGGKSVQIFFVYSNGGPANTLTLNGLTLADGNASYGGAIENNGGKLAISNSNFVSNTATYGGVIANENFGTINGITNTNFISNTASAVGGAIHNSLHATINSITNSTFTANTAIAGGAIYNLSNGIVNSIINSTFTANTGTNGGAIYNNDYATINSITNSTFIANIGTNGGAIYNGFYGYIGFIFNSNLLSNSAGNDGGAILNKDNGIINSIANSALISNTALGVGGGAIENYNSSTINGITNTTFVSNTSNYGGAIYIYNSSLGGITNTTFVSNTAGTSGADINNNGGTITSTNSIFADGSSGNCSGTVGDNGGNLSDDNSCNFSPSSHNNVSNLNLGMLGDYGGNTETVRLLAGSVAIGEASANCPATDQRSVPRPATNCDAGAFQTTSVTLTSTPNPSTYGQPIAITATVCPTTTACPTPTGTVTFTIGSATATATVSSGTATYVTNTLPIGSTVITATYSGDNIYTSGTSNQITQTVHAISSTISLTSAPNPSTVGQSVTFTATVNPATITGTVTFTNTTSNTTLGTAPVGTNGTAVITSSFASSGTYSITASYSGNVSYTASTSNILVQVVTATTVTTPTIYTYYLPFVANNASNFTTYLATQNIGNASANVTVTYYSNSGNVLSAATVVTQVAQYGEVLPSNPLASGTSGAGIITSDQPLNVIVPEATPYGGSAYAVNSGSSSSLIAPFAINNAFGDFTTQLNVFNGGSSAVTATVTFYGTVGNSTTITSSSTTVNIAAHTTANLNQNTLPSGFSGWAQITGSANTLVAQVLEQSPSQKFVAIANAIANPSTTEYAPAIFAGGYGGFYTGANIINPNANPVTVTVTYYDLSANATATTPFIIPGHGVASIFQGNSSGNGLPSGGLPKNFVGSAAVTSVGGPIAMSVNENGGQTSTGNSRSGTYAAISSGGSTVGLPVISNGGYTYVTGDTIFNTSTQTVTATLTYYNINGTAANIATKNLVIPGKGSAAVYQGDGSVPSNFYGTAVITESAASPANALIVTTNAQSSSLFYTYSEPNS